ncbi:arabinan endo-1,5-alpha-L-arabinosidase [Acidobacteria bacterium AB60]|nr:arabinan endo-1,5-alpha-L-arabinosidase [Acidobacteria bacterium AB60]
MRQAITQTPGTTSCSVRFPTRRASCPSSAMPAPARRFPFTSLLSSRTLCVDSRKGCFPLMSRVKGPVVLCLLPFLLSLCSCATVVAGKLQYPAVAGDPLSHYALTGDILPVLDPSIIRQDSTYYAFSTDVVGVPQSGSLPIRCSPDKTTWTTCGYVFPNGMPSWIQKRLPGVLGLWAPDISWFNGEYHLYYNASILNTQTTLIGLATNTTLDPNDPAYHWVDRGLVLQSRAGDDFNALDPNIFLDADGAVWLTYGSYWSGIKQRQIDPSTGMLLAANPTRYDLATRPDSPDDAIEGASLVRHGAFYYLFVSVDHCCKATVAEDNYKQAVGRSTSAHGPFLDEAGTPMLQGGGSVLLQGNGSWNAPGGGTAYLDDSNGDSLLIFHAQNLSKGGTPFAWVKTLQWTNDWPVLAD